MSDGKHFFTFPLCLLAMPVEEKKRLDIVISHSALRAGKGDGSKGITHAQCKKEAKEKGYTFYGSQFQLALIRGSIVCGIRLGSLEASEKECNAAHKFITEHEARYGPCPLVFVSGGLLWGCYKSQEPSFRDFSTLCAINSIVGFKKSPVLIRRTLITARQLGYKTPAVMQLAKREDQTPLTTQQLRDTLDRLEVGDLIARRPNGHSNIYFSTTLNYQQLTEAVDALRAKKSKLELRRELERTESEPKKNQ